MKEQIILTLVYLRHLTTFELLSFQFGVSESTANNTFIFRVGVEAPTVATSSQWDFSKFYLL
ncbi:helix-turn-helix domain-containing protein [Nostoc sp.]|uniref:helix-turn-helix domain-containing protein n=1 Tax=Nostoc sp. TaxID=1180 RepID=UPI003FA5AE1F